MKRNNLLIFGLAAVAGAGYYFYNLKQTAAALTARIYKIGFDFLPTRDSLFTRIYFWVEILVNNPNSQVIPVSNINISLLFNKTIAATASRTESTNIAGNASTVIRLQVGIPVLNLFRNITDAIKLIQDKESLTFDIIGSISVPGGAVKIAETKSVQIG